jgi:hypothetical protein
MRWLLAVLLVPRFAVADDDPPLPAPPPPPREASYRGEVATADLVSLGTVAPVALIAAPIVHLAHGHPGRAAASLALRATCVLGGIYLGSRYDHTDDDVPIGAMLGALAGIATASALDITVLAGPAEAPRAVFAPSIVPARDGMTFGLAGAF